MTAACLIQIELDLGDALPSPELEQEQRVAIFDLVEENSFALPEGAPQGPYSLTLGRAGSRLAFHLTAGGADAAQFELSFGPMRQVVKDYHQICDSYYDAVKTAAASEIEALDDARRGIHREGAHALMDRLDGKAVVDEGTARRLFTLVCVLMADD